MPTRVSPAWLYLLAPILAATLFLPEWLTVPYGDGGVHHGSGYAGLWCVDLPFRGYVRWDNLRVDLDMYGLGYAAFALGLVVVGYLVAIAAGRRHLVHPAKKLALALLIVELLFVARLLIESGVGLYVLAVIGPLTSLVAHRVLTKLAGM